MQALLLQLSHIAPFAFVFLACVLVSTIVTQLPKKLARSHQSCARCRYDIEGLDPATSPCPECGSDLSTPDAIRIGRPFSLRDSRELRQVLAVIAAVLIAWGLQSVNWYGLLSPRSLVALVSGDAASSVRSDAAWELQRRASVRQLSTKDTAKVIRLLEQAIEDPNKSTDQAIRLASTLLIDAPPGNLLEIFETHLVTTTKPEPPLRPQEPRIGVYLELDRVANGLTGRPVHISPEGHRARLFDEDGRSYPATPAVRSVDTPIGQAIEDPYIVSLQTEAPPGEYSAELELSIIEGMHLLRGQVDHVVHVANVTVPSVSEVGLRDADVSDERTRLINESVWLAPRIAFAPLPGSDSQGHVGKVVLKFFVDSGRLPAAIYAKPTLIVNGTRREVDAGFIPLLSITPTDDATYAPTARTMFLLLTEPINESDHVQVELTPLQLPDDADRIEASRFPMGSLGEPRWGDPIILELPVSIRFGLSWSEAMRWVRDYGG